MVIFPYLLRILTSVAYCKSTGNLLRVREFFISVQFPCVNRLNASHIAAKVSGRRHLLESVLIVMNMCKNLSITDISKLSGLTRRTVYRAFTGRSTPDSLIRIQTAIYKITGRKIPVMDISMGQYSSDYFIKKICKKIKPRKHGITCEVTAYSCGVYDIRPCTFCSDSYSDFRILL